MAPNFNFDRCKVTDKDADFSWTGEDFSDNSTFSYRAVQDVIAHAEKKGYRGFAFHSKPGSPYYGNVRFFDCEVQLNELRITTDNGTLIYIAPTCQAIQDL